MRSFAGKIEVMKTMPWPMALVVSVAITVIGILSYQDKDINVVVNAVLLLLMALGYAELREVKTNTNGGTARLQDQNERLQETNATLLKELAAHRQTQALLTEKLLNAPPEPE